MIKASNLNKIKILNDFTINMYGYKLIDSYKYVFSENRSYLFDKLLCEYTKQYFTFNKNDLNLHRWSLENKNKTINEKNYPW